MTPVMQNNNKLFGDPNERRCSHTNRSNDQCRNIADYVMRDVNGFEWFSCDDHKWSDLFPGMYVYVPSVATSWDAWYQSRFGVNPPTSEPARKSLRTIEAFDSEWDLD